MTESSALVLDTSAAAALFLQEENGRVVEEALGGVLSGNGQIFVPSLFWFEIGNVLLIAFRRKRISRDEIFGIENDLAELPLVTDGTPEASIRSHIREIAFDSDLSYYDSAYVELAKRLCLPLLSFDRRVNEAMA